jgi:homoserine dehydrogenase
MKIGLLGYGTVGGGVAALVRERDDMDVTRILCRSVKPELASLACYDFEDILHDREIDTVVEVMGGLHPAYEYVVQALKAGKNVVTANKNLISAYYADLIPLAREHGAALRCTAACGGGIPWLVNLERCKRLDRIDDISGIMNGTSNFILDAMHASPIAFDEVLRQAQELGYAEADPSADIDGDDIRRKLVISANVAFDALLSESDVPMFGIRTVTAGDIAAFKSHGFVCKLVATALHSEDGVSAYIEPTLFSARALESAVPTNFNLISFTGEKLGRQSYFGQGAGRFPTACNVVQDCIDILGGKTAFYTDCMERLPVDAACAMHPYYVRTSKPDAWLSGVTADRWADGVVTGAVSTFQMLAWAKQQLTADPACFIAGIQ